MYAIVEIAGQQFKVSKDQKVFVVPLVLSYHFVLEAQFLIEQQLRIMGKERYIRAKDAFYSPWSVLKFAWQVFSRENDIVLSHRPYRLDRTCCISEVGSEIQV